MISLVRGGGGRKTGGGRKQPHRKTERNFLEGHLKETEKDIESAREDGSWQAVDRLRRLAITIRAELDALDREAGEGPGPEVSMTEAELVADLVAAVSVLPLDQLDAIAAALRRRLGPGSV